MHLMTQYPLRFCLVGQPRALSTTQYQMMQQMMSPSLGGARGGDGCSENHSGSSLATETTNDTLSGLTYLQSPQLPAPLAKRLRLLAYASRFTLSSDCSLRIYAVLDTPDAVRHVRETERQLDGQLLGDRTPKQLIFKNSGGGLVFRMQEVPPHWRTRVSFQVRPQHQRF